MSSIYEIDAAILALFDPETGEFLGTEEDFTRLNMEREAKVRNTALFLKNRRADSAAIKAEIKVLQDRARVIDNMVTRLEKLLDYALQGQRFECPECVVSYRKSVRLEVADEAAVVRWARESGNLDAIREKPPEVSKDYVKRLVKDGVAVPACTLVEARNIQIK